MKARLVLLISGIFFGCVQPPIQPVSREPNQVPQVQPINWQEKSERCYLSPEALKAKKAQYDLRLKLYKAKATVKATINARKIETTLMAPQEEISLIETLRTNPSPDQATQGVIKFFSNSLSHGETSILQADLPYPRSVPGPVAKEIRKIVKQNLIKKYLFEWPVTDLEIQDLRDHGRLSKDLWRDFDDLVRRVHDRTPNTKESEIVNKEKPPGRSAMDQYLVHTYMDFATSPFVIDYNGLRPITAQQGLAIDALARTLMGEALMCDTETDQFAAISRIVLSRTEELVKALEKKTSPLKKFGRDLDKKIGQLDDETVLKAAELHPVAQIVSASLQFDAWATRSEGPKIPVSSLRARGQKPVTNIPLEATFGFFGPSPWNSMSDLSYTLCPVRPGETGRTSWDNAVGYAKEVVLDPETFKAQYRWNPNANVLYYSHGPDVKGMKVVPGIQLMKCVDNKARNCKPLRLYTGPGSCRSVRFFVP